MPNENYCSRRVSPRIRQELGQYRGAGTWNTALLNAAQKAEIAIKQRAKVDYIENERGASLHIAADTVDLINGLARQYTGQDLSFENSILVVLALAAAAKA